MESLSDHKYVFFAVDASLTGPVIEGTALKLFPRWIIGKVNPNLMEAAVVFSAWSDIPEDAVLGAERMDQILRDISDAQEGVVEETHHLLVEPGDCGSSPYLQRVQKASHTCVCEEENLSGIPMRALGCLTRG